MKRQNPLFLEPEIAETQLFRPHPTLGKVLSPELKPDEFYYTHKDVWEEFDRLLLAHYGEPIREPLNAARAEDGWLPL
jgi:hypothetical protein